LHSLKKSFVRLNRDIQSKQKKAMTPYNVIAILND
jgi:hypothetical protein